ncbi:MAG: HAMP domain-containing protein [Candidatus Schekmanbacteria bacterium]|nr:MAG: HAMP domain-containing protein [Candidatus Schekmanbacteria bacterium]
MFQIKSLKTQFLLWTSLIIFCLVCIIGYFEIVEHRNLLISKVKENGRILVETMSAACINTMLYQELGLVEEGGLLDNYIEEIMERKELHIRYAYILDESNHVLVSSNLKEFGKKLIDTISYRSFISNKTLEQVYKDEITGEKILDISTPLSIAGKRWGTLKVGFSLKFIKGIIFEHYKRIILFALISMCLSIVVINFVFLRLTNPLKKLTNSIKEISSPDEFKELPIESADEVGELTREFNELMERLKKSMNELEHAQRIMASQEKYSSLGRVAAGIAHEINNPLDGIQDCIKLLDKDIEESDKKKKYLRMSFEGLKRIEKIVKGLLDFSSERPISLREVNINTLISSSTEILTFKLKEKNIKLIIENSLDGEIIKIDSSKIQQVLMNLLLNSIDSLENKENGKIILKISKDKGNLILEVIDNGIGIAKEDIDKIYEPFYTTKEVGKGTGLGLSITKGIVEAFGGEIQCRSTPNVETVFTVIIPIAN